MSKTVKIWLIVSVSLVLVGGIIFTGAMAMSNWNIKKLSTSKYETNNYNITDAFNRIYIDSSTSDINIIPSEDGACRVVCYEQSNVKHEVSTVDGTLEIAEKDSRKWYEYIGINFNTPKITVYLPESQYCAVSIKSSTGDIEIAKEFKLKSIDIMLSTGDVRAFASTDEDISIVASTGKILVENVTAGKVNAITTTGSITLTNVTCTGDINADVTTGSMNLTDITCTDLNSDGGTGDISLDNVIASGKFNIKRSTGDVEFNRCDAKELFIKTGKGDVKGSLISEKVFITNTSTGDIEVPKSVTGGLCEITTSTGDIDIEIK